MKDLKISMIFGILALFAVIAYAEEARINLSQEVDLAEMVAAARSQYKISLENLIEFYNKLGDATKLGMAKQELDALDAIAKPQYVLMVHNLEPLMATENILEANRLYNDGVSYKKAPELFEKKQKLDIAAARFTELLEKYPRSDKVDDACYMLGEIYEGYYFKDYPRAAKYFEKCFEVNPDTTYPARFKAAQIYYEKLKMLGKAMKLYEETRDHDPVFKNRQISAERLELLKATYVPPTKPKETEK